MSMSGGNCYSFCTDWWYADALSARVCVCLCVCVCACVCAVCPGLWTSRRIRLRGLLWRGAADAGFVSDVLLQADTVRSQLGNRLADAGLCQRRRLDCRMIVFCVCICAIHAWVHRCRAPIQCTSRAGVTILPPIMIILTIIFTSLAVGATIHKETTSS